MGFDAWARRQSPARRALLEAMHFEGKSAFQFALLPGEGGAHDVVTTVANADELSPWCLARLGESLAAGNYRLAEGSPGIAALGWLLAQHRFERYKSTPRPERGARVLLTGEAAGDRPDRAAGARRPRWSATWSTRPPPTLGRPSSRRSRAILPTNLAPRSRSPTATRSRPAIR